MIVQLVVPACETNRFAAPFSRSQVHAPVPVTRFATALKLTVPVAGVIVSTVLNECPRKASQNTARRQHN